jgi:hypothetical protein
MLYLKKNSVNMDSHRTTKNTYDSAKINLNIELLRTHVTVKMG